MGLPHPAITTLSSFAGVWAYPVNGMKNANAQVKVLAMANRKLINAQDMRKLSGEMKTMI
jgi:hypothetical protein